MCIFKNYIAIITADHGEEFGEHGGLMHRGSLYDELLHVPLNELINMADDYPDVRERLKEKLAHWKSNRLKLEEIKERRLQYSKEELEKLRTLGYIE